MTHVDRDIEQLEGPAKKSRSELFLLPSSTLDNTSSDLLDLRVIEGRLANPFVVENFSLHQGENQQSSSSTARDGGPAARSATEDLAAEERGDHSERKGDEVMSAEALTGSIEKHSKGSTTIQRSNGQTDSRSGSMQPTQPQRVPSPMPVSEPMHCATERAPYHPPAASHAYRGAAAHPYTPSVPSDLRPQPPSVTACAPAQPTRPSTPHPTQGKAEVTPVTNQRTVGDAASRGAVEQDNRR